MDVSNGFGSIFRQVFLGKRGNVADAIFAIADAINNLAAAQQKMHTTLLESPQTYEAWLRSEFERMGFEFKSQSG